jgi:hypothetical protein
METPSSYQGQMALPPRHTLGMMLLASQLGRHQTARDVTCNVPRAAALLRGCRSRRPVARPISLCGSRRSPRHPAAWSGLVLILPAGVPQMQASAAAGAVRSLAQLCGKRPFKKSVWSQLAAA